MSATRCPTCQLPLTEAELIGGACPTCATPLAAPEPVAVVAPVPPRELTMPFWLHERFLLFVALLLCGVCGGGLVVVFNTWRKDVAELRTINEQQAEQLANVSNQLAEGREAIADLKHSQALNLAEAQTRSAKEKALESQVALHQERAQHLDQELKTLAPELAEWRALKDAARKVIPNMPAFPEGATHILALDRADAEYRIPALTTKRVVKVTGKLKVLRVEHISEATLDASELEVGEIIFGGGITNKAKVKLKCHQGTVTILYIDSQSTLDIIAPESKVAIGWINNTSTVNVTARELSLRQFVDGKDTTINAIITKGGKLRSVEMRGPAQLFWKKAHPADPDITIEMGKLGPQAVFREQGVGP